MSKRSEILYLGNMLDSARSANMKVSSVTRAQFDADENLQLALTFLLQIIGEAARHVSEETQKAHPEIPWVDIIGMRHKLVHDYFEIRPDEVWKTASEDLPVLIAALEKIVPPVPPE